MQLELCDLHPPQPQHPPSKGSFSFGLLPVFSNALVISVTFGGCSARTWQHFQKAKANWKHGSPTVSRWHCVTVQPQSRHSTARRSWDKHGIHSLEKSEDKSLEKSFSSFFLPSTSPKFSLAGPCSSLVWFPVPTVPILSHPLLPLISIPSWNVWNSQPLRVFYYFSSPPCSLPSRAFRTSCALKAIKMKFHETLIWAMHIACNLYSLHPFWTFPCV